MSATREPRRGTTLIELLVVLVLLAVVAAVTAIALGRPAQRRPDDRAARLAEARREAVSSGRAVSVILVNDGGAAAATAHPDGRAIVDEANSTIDVSTGRPVHAR